MTKMGKYHPDKDGLGNPIDPAAEYYIQDSRTCVGNAMMWWAIEARGYVCDLDKAGVFTGEEAMKHRTTDIPWPVDFVRGKTTKIVDIQHVRNHR